VGAFGAVGVEFVGVGVCKFTRFSKTLLWPSTSVANGVAAAAVVLARPVELNRGDVELPVAVLGDGHNVDGSGDSRGVVST